MSRNKVEQFGITKLMKILVVACRNTIQRKAKKKITLNIDISKIIIPLITTIENSINQTSSITIMLKILKKSMKTIAIAIAVRTNFSKS